MDAGRTLRATLVVGAVAALAACGGGAPPQAGPTVTVTATAPGSPQPAPKTSASAGVTATPGRPRKQKERSAPQQTIRVTGVVVGSLDDGPADDGTGALSTSPQSETRRGEDDRCEGWRWKPSMGTWTKGLVEGARIVLHDPATGRDVGAARLGLGRAVDVDPGPGEQWQCEFGVLGGLTGTAPDRLQFQVDGARTMNAVRAPGTVARYIASVSTNADPAAVRECRMTDQAGGPGRWEEPAVGESWGGGMALVCWAGWPVSSVERVCRPARIASDRVVAVLDDNTRTVLEDARGIHFTSGSAFGAHPAVVVQVSTGVPCR